MEVDEPNESQEVRDCILCDEPLLNDIKEVSEKCRQTLKAASTDRKDSLHARFNRINNLRVHNKCYVSYTHAGNIAAAVKKALRMSPKKRRSAGEFAFNNLCFFCNCDASDTFILSQSKKPEKKRVVVRKMENQETLDKILEKTKKLKTPEAIKISALLSKIDFIKMKRDDNLPRYHHLCFIKFHKSEPPKPSRIKNSDPIVEHVMDFLEKNRDECQFLLKDIMKTYPGEMQELKHICSKLLKYHNNEIIICRKKNREIVICFKDKAYDILTQSWYDQKKEDPIEERKRIVLAAANILLEDVRAMVYDNEFYPPSGEFYDKIDNDVPETMKLLFDTICTKNKKGNLTPYYRKSVNLAHSLIKVIRPNSFVSPIQVGVASILHEKTGCKDIVNLLCNYGYSASYHEVKRFRKSLAQNFKDVMTDDPPDLRDCTLQFVYDNADHNVRTLNGSGTFHAMGGVMIVTPYRSIATNTDIPRLKEVPTSEIVSEMSDVQLLSNDINDRSKLSEVTFENLDEKFPSDSPKISSENFLWSYSKVIKPEKTSGRNGFLEKLVRDNTFSVSKIIFLPFVNAPPSHEDTIYTVLMQAVRKSKFFGKKYAIVTFDLPLFLKAYEMISCAPDDSDLQLVILRLGGFHMFMSYWKAVGFIMKNSGLKDLFCLAFGQNSVDKVFECSNYARTVRCHELAYLAIIKVVISEMNLSEPEERHLREILDNIDTSVIEKINHPDFLTIRNKFDETLIELSNRGPTSKLWVQYLHLVAIGFSFLDSERVGNWQGHLSSAKQMVPVFHASGHFHYAKATPLHLQEMSRLKEKMSVDEFKRFTEEGHFTVRRTDKFRSGTWTDMIIEQTVMKSMKSQGGLTHGRGVEDSVTTEWVMSMPSLFEVNQSVLDHGNISFNTNSGQHADASDARITIDNDIVDSFYNWFSAHNPFAPTQEIMCISTGLIGEKNIVDCHKAIEKGTELMRSTYGSTWTNMKFQRKNRVNTLQAVNTTKKSDVPNIDPALLFQRICVWKRNEEELQKHLTHELAPYPLSIFDDNGLRKNNKADFYDSFKPEEKPPTFKDSFIIIDGGFLLHRVVWNRNSTYGKVSEQYITYIRNNYAKNNNTCMVYFDGYPENANDRGTKNVERIRRKQKCTSPTYVITDDSPTICQRSFLSNDTNKNNFIQLLKEKLSNAGFLVNQAKEDVDAELVRSAINFSAAYPSVGIVGEDIDILVILNQLAFGINNIYFFKVAKGRGGKKIYRSNSFKYPLLKNYITLLHAFSGCDTTSAFYNQGKLKFITILNEHEDLRKQVEIFYDHKASQVDVEKAGEAFIKHAYQDKPKENVTLNDLRFTCFQKSCAKKTFNLAFLPPTEAAMKFHSRRVFYQLRLWDMDKTIVDKIDVREWGWKFIDNYGLAPETTDVDLVPVELMSIISCACTTGCATAKCSCKKVGLYCTILCKGCEGKNCNNVDHESRLLDNHNDDEFDDDEHGLDMSEMLNCELAIDNSDESDDDIIPDYESDEVIVEPRNLRSKKARLL